MCAAVFPSCVENTSDDGNRYLLLWGSLSNILGPVTPLIVGADRAGDVGIAYLSTNLSLRSLFHPRLTSTHEASRTPLLLNLAIAIATHRLSAARSRATLSFSFSFRSCIRSFFSRTFHSCDHQVSSEVDPPRRRRRLPRAHTRNAINPSPRRSLSLSLSPSLLAIFVELFFSFLHKINFYYTKRNCNVIF